MPLIEHYRAMARNNAWSNARLMAACRQLSPAEFVAQRTSFFPSLSLTLNHILIVDWYYLDALEGGGRGVALFAEEEPYPLIDDLARAQDAADRRLIAYCDRLEAADLGRDLLGHGGGRGAEQAHDDQQRCRDASREPHALFPALPGSPFRAARDRARRAPDIGVNAGDGK